MSDTKIREKIVKVLTYSNEPMTFDQLAEEIGITREAYVISHNLNHLSIRGVIVEHKGTFGGSSYSLTNK